MDAASQQRILGYFIEEAKEHLDTLEQGILELSDVVADNERVNEMFRAAHSVKGGAAMLGYGSIQKTAHRLEDAFKILKENTVPVDQQLETLFLHSYDILKDLLDRLQTPFGLQDADGQKIVQDAEPKFTALQQYLEALVSGKTPPIINIPETKPQGETPASATPVIPVTPIAVATTNTPQEIRNLLKEMLKYFQEKVSPEHRKKVQGVLVKLSKLAPKDENWQKVLKVANKAIANPQYSYSLLAPVIIHDLKFACDCIELGKNEDIKPSEDLQRLAMAKVPQVLIPVEPKSAVKVLLKSFNKKQLAEIVQLLGTTR